jgi:hypothetical protein
MDAFLYNIRAVCLCSGVNIKLEIIVTKKRSLFPTLANLYRFLNNWSLSAALSMQSLFRVKPVFISRTKIVFKEGL